MAARYAVSASSLGVGGLPGVCLKKKQKQPETVLLENQTVPSVEDHLRTLVLRFMRYLTASFLLVSADNNWLESVAYAVGTRFGIGFGLWVQEPLSSSNRLL